MRVRLIALPGWVYTNNIIYGKDIILAEGLTEEGFYQITDEEYQERNSRQEEIINETDNNN